MTREDVLFFIAVIGAPVAVISCIYQIAAYYRPPGAGSALPAHKKKRAWPRPILFNAVIALIVCGAVGLDYWERTFDKPLFVQPLKWGITPGTPQSAPHFYMSFDSSTLAKFGRQDRLFLIARGAFPEFDEVTDKAIEVSPPFTITGQLLTIDFQVRGKMRAIVGSSPYSEYLVMMPNGIETDDITCLRDVSKLGGRIITITGGDLHLLAPAASPQSSTTPQFGRP
jgi:hypothetical protein